jgi:hypothetical protein
MMHTERDGIVRDTKVATSSIHYITAPHRYSTAAKISRQYGSAARYPKVFTEGRALRTNLFWHKIEHDATSFISTSVGAKHGDADCQARFRLYQ